MSKPEDISQEAWDAATACYEALPLVYDGWDETEVVSGIAHAIVAATSAERETIADWAEATADHYDAASIADAIKDVPANRAVEKALKAFAAAIRKRGTP